MVRRTFLPFAILALAGLAACSAQAGTLTPSLPTDSLPVSAGTSTPVPSFTVTPIPTASVTPIAPALPVLAAPALVWIDFQDAQDGWGIAITARGSVLRTLDGGSTWLEASPPGIGPLGLSDNLTVLNSNTAWVLVPGSDFFSGTLYRTGDGGSSWNSSKVPFSGALMQFQDDSHGFALAERGANAGSEAVELFQTSDGGVRWTSMFHNDPGLPGASDSLPLVGIKNGMTFVDANTGWVTGSIPVDGEIYLYTTRDGGASWSQQRLPLPAGYEQYRYLPQAPIFFGQDGFLPLTIYRPEAAGLTFLAAETEANCTFGADLYSSRDGARTWDKAHPGLNLGGNLSRLESAPGFTGWALTRLDEAGHSQLYHSTDGLNWMPLIP